MKTQKEKSWKQKVGNPCSRLCFIWHIITSYVLLQLFAWVEFCWQWRLKETTDLATCISSIQKSDSGKYSKGCDVLEAWLPRMSLNLDHSFISALIKWKHICFFVFLICAPWFWMFLFTWGLNQNQTLSNTILKPSESLELRTQSCDGDSKTGSKKDFVTTFDTKTASLCSFKTWTCWNGWNWNHFKAEMNGRYFLWIILYFYIIFSYFCALCLWIFLCSSQPLFFFAHVPLASASDLTDRVSQHYLTLNMFLFLKILFWMRLSGFTWKKTLILFKTSEIRTEPSALL